MKAQPLTSEQINKINSLYKEVEEEPKTNKQARLLVLYKILNRETPLSISEIVKELQINGYYVAQKTIYKDMSLLRDNGFEIDFKHYKYRIADKEPTSEYNRGRDDMLNEICKKIKYYESHNTYYEDVIEDTKKYLWKLKLKSLDNNKNK